ncbi:MAG: hypothetical protein NVS2B14_15720 [Chamaesiphon sp.]
MVRLQAQQFILRTVKPDFDKAIKLTNLLETLVYVPVLLAFVVTVQALATEL